MINLSSFIAFHARRTPDRCALKYRGENVSYADFDLRIRQVGSWLVSCGIAPGDVVAVLMKNSTSFLELVFATSHIGAVFLPINYRCRPMRSATSSAIPARGCWSPTRNLPRS